MRVSILPPCNYRLQKLLSTWLPKPTDRAISKFRSVYFFLSVRHMLQTFSGHRNGVQPLESLGFIEYSLRMQAYQFSSDGILRLPPFQLISSKASASGGPPQHSPVDSGMVSILTLYSRVYCAILERKERCLSLYRFYKYVHPILKLTTLPHNLFKRTTTHADLPVVHIPCYFSLERSSFQLNLCVSDVVWKMEPF